MRFKGRRGKPERKKSYKQLLRELKEVLERAARGRRKDRND